MEPANTPKTENKKTKKTHKVRTILILLAIVILIIPLCLLIAIPSIVSSDTGNRFILNKINASVDGKAEFASLSMSWKKGINIKDITYNSTAGDISLDITSVTTVPHYRALIAGDLSFGQVDIQKPHINIDLRKQTQTKKTSDDKDKDEDNNDDFAMPLKQIDLTINDGLFAVTDKHGKTAQISSINSKLNLPPSGKQVNFLADMSLSNDPKNSNIAIKADMTSKTKKQWSLKGATGSMELQVNNLDIGSLAPFLAMAGVDIQTAGSTSAELNANIKDGHIDNLTGTVNAKNIDITGNAIKGDHLKTDKLIADIKLTRKNDMINIDTLNIASDWLNADASGEVPASIDAMKNFIDSQSTLTANFECSIAPLLSQMPKTFSIKDNMNITAGSIKGKITTGILNNAKNITVDASLADLAGTMDNKQLALSKPIEISAKLQPDKDIINIQKFDISSSFTTLKCSGTSEKLQYTAAANFSLLQSELEQFFDMKGYKIAGTGSEQGTVTIGKETITFVGSGQIKDFVLNSKTDKVAEPLMNATFDMAINYKDKFLTVNSMKTNASLGKIAVINSNIDFNKETPKPSKISISASDIDLAKAYPFAVMFASAPKETSLAGIANGDLIINKNKSIYDIKTDNTKINNLKVSYPNQEDFIQKEVNFTTHAILDNDNKTYNIDYNLDSQDIKSKGHLEKKDQDNITNLQGNANIQYDWQNIQTLLANKWPKQLNITGKRNKNILFSSKYKTSDPNGFINNLDLTTSAGLDNAGYHGLNLSQIDPNITIKKGVLIIEPITANLNQGKTSFAAKMDLTKKPLVFQTTQPLKLADKVMLNDDMATSFLRYIHPIFADTINVKGSGNLDCDRMYIPLSKDEIMKMNFEGTFGVDTLEFSLKPNTFFAQLLSLAGQDYTGQKFTINPTKFLIKDGQLTYKDLQLNVGNIPVNFKDVIIGLDKSYEMTISLPWSITGKNVTLDKNFADNRFELRVNAPPGQQPQIDLQKMFQDQLQKLLIDQLKNKATGQIESEIGEAIKDALGDDFGDIFNFDDN